MPQPQAWRVTAQQETTLPGASGTFTKGIQVFFTTAAGVTASVFVPELLYAPAKVRELILAKVAALEGVSNLTG
jgi:hypothetical protein